MIMYFVVIYLIWFVKAPWWLYIPMVACVIAKTIQFLMEIYEEGKESR